MSIICGTTLESPLDPAVRTASVLAARLGDSLRLVHAIESPIDRYDAATQQAVLAHNHELLAAETVRLAASLPGGVKGELRRGRASEVLLASAEKRRATLLVVAAQGGADGPLWRLGGTSEKVAQRSAVPVLVTRNAAPFEAWAREGHALRILCAVDDSAASDAPIAWVKRLRQAGPCDVTFLQAYYRYEAEKRYGPGSAPRRFGEVDPELERVLERDMAHRVGDVPGEGRVSFRALGAVGRLADHILARAESEGADLIVVGTHHRSGLRRLGSVASGVLHYATISVACIPGSERLAERSRIPRLRRVLVATDLSPEANAALPYAYAMVGGHGEVWLCHVVPEKEPDEEPLARRLSAIAERMPPPPGVEVQHHVARGGDVTRSVVVAAERLGVDAVCLVRNSHGPLARVLLSSVATEVARDCRQPVLLVQPSPS